VLCWSFDWNFSGRNEESNFTMNNVEFKVTGNKLVIEVDIGPKMVAAAQPSASGKTRMVASTGGFTPVTNGNGRLALSLNVTTKA
jgi:hypothetical protein